MKRVIGWVVLVPVALVIGCCEIITTLSESVAAWAETMIGRRVD